MEATINTRIKMYTSIFVKFSLVLTLTLTVSACGEKQPKIKEGAIIPLNAENVPGIVAKVGIADFERSNTLLQTAAETAARSKSCDEVEYVMLDPLDSSPGRLMFKVFCTNKAKFTLRENELGRENIKSNKAKSDSISESAAKKMCESAIKDRLNFPATYESNTLIKQSVFRADNGNLRVTINFNAKTGFGTNIAHTGTCLISNGSIESPGDVVIKTDK
jgi:hypothetical protein